VTLVSAVPAPRDRWLVVVRYGTAGVWLFHGLFSKLLSGIPRHQQIVGRVLGETLARPATLFVGALEVVIGVWILSRRWPRRCAAVQTALLVGMNVLELTFAWDLLLAPVAMVCANAVFLGLGWLLAVRTPERA
jgi:uncharacterized membrane protein YphA (DoxX/SURF4 family)